MDMLCQMMLRACLHGSNKKKKCAVISLASLCRADCEMVIQVIGACDMLLVMFCKHSDLLSF